MSPCLHPLKPRTYQTNMPDLEYDSTFPASGGSLEESHRIFQSDWRTSSWTSPTGRRSASSRTGCRGGESWQVRRLVTRLWLLDLPLQHNTQRCSVRHGPWLQVWDGFEVTGCAVKAVAMHEIGNTLRRSGGGAVHLMGLNGGREHCGQEKERRQLVETLSPAALPVHLSCASG